MLVLQKELSNYFFFSKIKLNSLKSISNSSDRNYFKRLLRQDIEGNLVKITGFEVRGVPCLDVVTSHTMACLNAYFKDQKYVN
jgi:hypothetical protein